MRIVVQLLLFNWMLFGPAYGLTTSATLAPTAAPSAECSLKTHPYNHTYPLTPTTTVPNGIKYRIAVVSDLDADSIRGNKTISHLKKGYLTFNPKNRQTSVEWDKGEPVELASGYSLKGRGMELSELVVFDGRLITVDDRTGIIYELDATRNLMHPWAIVPDGDGKALKGFKAEWAAVKDETLYVGGLGKEWTTPTGEFVNNDPFWVKTISASGEVKHIDWQENYKLLRRAQQIEWPGYMIHESGAWSSVHNRWFFLPRRSSKLQYNEKTDEHMSANVLLSATDDFSKVTVTKIGELTPNRGYSSFKFIPGSEDTAIVALKSVEDKGVAATYITVFTITGDIILPDTKITDEKCEGIEFI